MSVGVCLNTFSYRRYQNFKTSCASYANGLLLAAKVQRTICISLAMYVFAVTAINKHDFLAEACFSTRCSVDPTFRFFKQISVTHT